MQMDVETVQAGPALAAHLQLQASPVRTCRASPVLLHVVNTSCDFCQFDYYLLLSVIWVWW